MFTLTGKSAFRAETKSYTIKYEQQRYWTGTSHSHTSNIMPEQLAKKVYWTKSRQSSCWIFTRLNPFQSSLILFHFRYGPNTCAREVRAKCALGAASLCHINRAEVPVLLCEQKPYPVRFLCLRKSHAVEREQLALIMVIRSIYGSTTKRSGIYK